MEVILLERVENLGQMGQVVNVKPGFARNYLLPLKKALRATKANLDVFEKQRAHLEVQNLERRKEAEAAAPKLAGRQAIIIRQSGETGVLYGSVSSRDIAEAFSREDVAMDRRQVAIAHPIKTLGLFDVRVVLHPEVSVTVKINVARSQEEARLQAERGGMLSQADRLREEEEAQDAAEARDVGEADQGEDEDA